MSDHAAPRRTLASRAPSILVNLLLVTITLGAVAYLAPSVLGYERYVITGGSMSGAFEKGSIALEKPVPVENLAVGDVITYQPPASAGVDNLVTHRIASITPGADGTLFRTKGDANAAADPWAFQLTASTQPVVQHTVPMVGYVFVALADQQIRMMLIGIPATLVALASLVELARALRPTGPTATATGASLPVPSRSTVAAPRDVGPRRGDRGDLVWPSRGSTLRSV